MSSQPLPAPTSHARKRDPERARRTPSTQVVVTVGIALLILFGWLRLILTLEIASTSRQIQILTKEKASIERDNDTLRLRIAKALSPERLALVAEELGYGLFEPVYVPLNSPLSGKKGPVSATQADNNEASLAQTSILWNLAGGELDPLLEVEAVP